MKLTSFKIRWHNLILIISIFFSGCAAVGLAEIGAAEAIAVARTLTLAEGVAGARVITLAEGLAGARTLTLAEGLAGARAIETAKELGIIMRSSLTTDGLGLIRRTIPAKEYSIIANGVIADEVSASSLFGRVRITRIGTSSPRLYLRTGYNEGVEFAEVTSNRSIRLLGGKEYSLPGRLYSVKPDVIKLREAPGTQYNVLAKITKDQVVIVLDEMPVNNWYYVRVGDKVGYILGSLLVMVGSDGDEKTSSISGVQYKNVSCVKCSGTGHTRCQACVGIGNNTCSSCHGEGKHTCSTCNAKGRLTCATCKGEGRRGNLNCNNCFGSGYLNCNTCYGSGHLNCNNCYGSGKLNCTTCYGNGNASCSVCSGTGIVQVRY